MAFMNNKETKASLTLYLVEKAVQFCKMPTVSPTHKGAFAAHSSAVRLRSAHNEAGTLMTLYAVVATG